MFKVKIFKLGFVYGVNFKEITNTINISPKNIQVKIIKSKLNLGSPDLSDYGYSDERLFSKFPQPENEEIIVGITIHPIEGNFFTRTNRENLIIITLHETDELLEKSGRTKEDLIAIELLTLILALQYKGELFHEETRGCIFDKCKLKRDMLNQLMTLQIEDYCRGELIRSGVSEDDIKVIEKILLRIKKPTFLKSIYLIFKNPISSFFFGGLLIGLVINTLSSLILGEFNSPSDYVISGVLFLLIPLLVIINFIVLRVKTREYKEK